MIHRYKRDAALELLAAVKYYEDQRPGLGGEFMDEVDAAITTIKEAPARWPEVGDRVRRYRLSRYPFNLVYQVFDDALVIIAVAHQHREPGYWRDRAT